MTTVVNEPSHHNDTSIERLERALDEWRRKIDRLLVQADLASMDATDEVRRATAAADNAWSAAAQKLHEIPKDAGSELGSLRAGVGKLLDDLKQAYQSAEAAVRRSRAGE